MKVKNNILCIDAGFRHMGFSVWSTSRNRFVRAGVVSTQKGNFNSVAESNLAAVTFLVKRLRTIIGEVNPRLVIAELPTGASRNANSAKQMAMAFAIVVTFCEATNLKLIPIKPSEVKRIADPTSKGNKSVDKQKVIKYVAKKHGDFLLNQIANANKEHVADSMVCLDVYKARQGRLLKASNEP